MLGFSWNERKYKQNTGAKYYSRCMLKLIIYPSPRSFWIRIYTQFVMTLTTSCNIHTIKYVLNHRLFKMLFVNIYTHTFRFKTYLCRVESLKNFKKNVCQSPSRSLISRKNLPIHFRWLLNNGLVHFSVMYRLSRYTSTVYYDVGNFKWDDLWFLNWNRITNNTVFAIVVLACSE